MDARPPGPEGWAPRHKTKTFRIFERRRRFHASSRAAGAIFHMIFSRKFWFEIYLKSKIGFVFGLNLNSHIIFSRDSTCMSWNAQVALASRICGSVTPFYGEFVHQRERQRHPKPLQDPPILTGSHGPPPPGPLFYVLCFSPPSHLLMTPGPSTVEPPGQKNDFLL